MNKILWLVALAISFLVAQEVDKGKIPAKHLDAKLKALPNGVAIWDAEEAQAALEGKQGAVVWVDTRTKSFFEIGTIKGAVLHPYDKKGKEPAGTLSKAELDQMIATGSKVVFFCQGPECHRSYNACFRAVGEWGAPAKQIIWFRAGYPDLLKHLEADPKLARKKAKYLVGKDAE